MCTVTFIPKGDGCCITSNRDEKSWRKPALPPHEYIYNGAQLIFPKDADAGGTWIAMKNNADAAVLLNGGFVKHAPAPPYRKSRGLIFLDIFSASNGLDYFGEINLHNIEPFTLILYIGGNLYECRWDGNQKHSKLLDVGRPHIWSSATLYDEEVVKRREAWFAQWLEANPQPMQQDILDFHRFGGEGDECNDFRMNRDGKVFTVSITSMAISDNEAVLRYLDLRHNQQYTRQAAITGSLELV